MSAAAASGLVADLLVGSTLLLGLGALAVLLSRAPVHRQRAAELATVATLVWLVLAIAPLPRRAETVPSAALAAATALLGRSSGVSDRREPGRLEGPGTATGGVRPATDFSVRSIVAPGSTVVSEPSGVHVAAPSRTSGKAEYASDRFDWRTLLLAIYAGGATVAFANLLLGAMLVRRLLARSVAPPPWLAEVFATRVHVAGVRRARLRITTASRRPLSAGILAPAVVLPSSLVDIARHAHLCCVIDHELVHVRRGDVASRALFAVAAIPLWAHPLFWFLRARATLASEMIADDAAAAAIGRNAYAHALVALSEDLHTLRSAPGLVPGTLRHRSELTRRIEMLVRKHDRLACRWTPARRAVHLAAAIVAVALCSAAFGVRPGPAAASPPESRSMVADATGEASADPAATAAATREALARDADAGTGSMASRSLTEPGQSLDWLQHVAGRQQRPQQQQPPQQPQRQQQPRQQPQQQQHVQLQQPPQQLQQQQLQQQPAGRQQPNPDAFYAETLALAERAITLRAEFEATAAELTAVEERVSVGAMQESDLMRVRLNLQMLERRLEAVMILVQAEVEATQIEIADVEREIQLGRLGAAARVQQVRLHGRLKVLQSVL